jgi:hypothetical protein
MPYAQGTEVPVSKTQIEISNLLTRAGAKEFAVALAAGKGAVQFVLNDRRVRFTVLAASPEDPVMRKQALAPRTYGTPSPERLRLVVEREDRRRWRVLLLAIKAKLEIVASGISSFDEEFLAHVVVNSGQTLYEWILTSAENRQRLLPAASAVQAEVISR